MQNALGKFAQSIFRNILIDRWFHFTPSSTKKAKRAHHQVHPFAYISLILSLLFHTHHRTRDGVQLHVHGVGAGGEDAGDFHANEEAGLADADGELGVGLPEDVGGFDVGEEEAVGVAGDGADELLDLHGLFVDGDIEGERAVTDAALDLAAVAHLGEHGAFDAGGHRVEHLLGGGDEGDLRLRDAEGLGGAHEVVRKLDLLAEVRSRDHGHVGDEDELVVVRVLDHAHVAQDTLRRKEAGLLVQDGAEELVGGAETLHQDFALAVMDHPHGLGNGLQLVLDVHDLELGNVDVVVGADFLDDIRIAHEGALHEALVGGEGCRLDRMLIDSPGCHHLFADALRLELGEKVVEILNHI